MLNIYTNTVVKAKIVVFIFLYNRTLVPYVPQSNELTRRPLSYFSTFVYRGSSHRRKSAACPKFDMVWLYRSPIPSREERPGGGWFRHSNDFYLPSLRVEEGGGGSAPCGVYCRIDLTVLSITQIVDNISWEVFYLESTVRKSISLRLKFLH
jgi:hypothetical protein